MVCGVMQSARSPGYFGALTGRASYPAQAFENPLGTLLDASNPPVIRKVDDSGGVPIAVAVDVALERGRDDEVAVPDRSFDHTVAEFCGGEKGDIGGGDSMSPAGRQLVLVDRNRDMFITPTLKRNFRKLGNDRDLTWSTVETFAWNDETDMLAAMTDKKFVVWYYPNVVFVDEDILPLTRIERTQQDGGLLGTGFKLTPPAASSFGENAQVASFTGTLCTLRRADGALVPVSVDPQPALLQEHARKKQWEDAIRLCRHIKMQELWACLAAMAVFGQDLNTAEVAYAAIDEVQKVEYICYIRDIPSSEGRAAEMALLRRQPREAENILLAANLVYRAIRMWINLYSWDRALELAVKCKTHVDTVLYFRGKYLKAMGRKETNKRFLQYAQGVTVEWDKIKAKMAMEEEAERTRSTAKPYVF
ncbi:hypothetical protein BDK51DRAFT_38038 [Blyttiomyces helicus]|uniref:Uncharacterized protein n=1 Tax=Blyttiomyces helicus TaxID=388810 RepID=A0A4P9VXM1_9FUNG|nr:hypothetical protein BDK51DRAFT_38038 [Blyttiomyces helicus]|eukprot:RKO83675.1 hypothetical protein BDK51DRAFT_38038 [Blyttiomyces helicus]